jgi:hypothetical protein
MASADSPFLTAEEAACWLHMTSAALAQKRMKGCGPPYYQPDGPTTKILYRLEDLEKWVSDGRVDGLTE